MYIAGKEIAHEHQYPYKAEVGYGNCKQGPYWNPGAKVVDHIIKYGASNDEIKAMVYEYGHAEVALYASDQGFGNYNSGVFDTCT